MNFTMNVNHIYELTTAKLEATTFTAYPKCIYKFYHHLFIESRSLISFDCKLSNVFQWSIQRCLLIIGILFEIQDGSISKTATIF